jgi:hypothetical protein
MLATGERAADMVLAERVALRERKELVIVGCSHAILRFR